MSGICRRAKIMQESRCKNKRSQERRAVALRAHVLNGRFLMGGSLSQVNHGPYIHMQIWLTMIR